MGLHVPGALNLQNRLSKEANGEWLNRGNMAIKLCTVQKDSVVPPLLYIGLVEDFGNYS